MLKSKILIGVIGQGYVGLPLSIEFGKKLNVIGFDLNSQRIYELNKKKDRNNDIKLKEFKLSKKVFFTDNISKLS